MAQRYDFTIDQGATWDKTFGWDGDDGNPVDITDYTARMQFRAGSPLAPNPPALDLSSADNGITLGGATGDIYVELAPATTRALVPGTVYYYDLELTDPTGTVVTRVVQGAAKVDAEVTR
jgi:hypothetical protein